MKGILSAIKDNRVKEFIAKERKKLNNPKRNFYGSQEVTMREGFGERAYSDKRRKITVACERLGITRMGYKKRIKKQRREKVFLQ